MIAVLPHLNAALNAIAATFLLCGFIFVKRRELDRHRACMTAAAATSCVFLISYVTLRFNAPIFAFAGEGVVRPIYFSILASHVVLAMVIVPLVLLTLFRAIKSDFMAHRRIARWTWPTWMYVSVSGIVVYLMLYQIYPPTQSAALLVQ
jgi:putative membrane protein